MIIEAWNDINQQSALHIPRAYTAILYMKIHIAHIMISKV